MSKNTLRALVSESLGSFFLFTTVVGSGIMAESLAGGNIAVALLGNTLATGAMLFVLVTMLGPISGAHFNPAVTLVMVMRKELTFQRFAAFVPAQIAFGIAGVWMAHLMFDVPIVQFSEKSRTGVGQWAGEFVATFGLIATIIGTSRHRPNWVPASVALYITAAYWFTSSTSFANPAITIGRSLTNTFAGIAPSDAPAFILAQLCGACAAFWLGKYLFAPE